MNIRQIIGENIRGYRKILGFTQKEFAKLAAMNHTYLASIERGEKNVTVDTIARISEVLGVPQHLLFIQGAYKWSRLAKRLNS